MAKRVISIRLNAATLAALDQVGLHMTRGRIIEAVLQSFLDRDTAAQRRILSTATGMRRQALEPAPSPIEVKAPCPHTSMYGADQPQAQTQTGDRPQAEDLSRCKIASSDEPAPIRARTDQEGG